MQIAVLGAGVMGQGIAQVCAMAGNTVTVRDIDEDIVADAIDAIDDTLAEGVEREKVTSDERAAATERISGTTDLAAAAADADMVIEAVPEDVDLKRDVFEAVEAVVPEEAILASNTSSLSITEVSSVLDRPERAVGLHFFNPPHIMQLVEVILGERTSSSTAETAESFVESLGKTPIVVRDSPGFASSRLGVTLGAEAMRMVETGVASPRDIDEAMKVGYNHPVGPLELTDIVGLDVRLGVLEYLQEELGERFRPPQILKRKVRSGKVGKKVGEGFYEWENGQVVEGSADGGER